MNQQAELEIDIYGTKYWKLNGLCHREDGPAIEYKNGAKEWWLTENVIVLMDQRANFFMKIFGIYMATSILRVNGLNI
jgi:hypothetical protein